jgi:hypothetical protein
LVVVVPDSLQFADWATLALEVGTSDADGTARHADRGNREHTDNAVIDSGSLDQYSPELKLAVWRTARVATHTRSIGVSLFQGLQELQTFQAEPSHERFSLIDLQAASWQDFLESGGVEPERIMELPMAKSVVRAMDTVSAFTSTLPTGTVKRFGLWGADLYGLACWEVGAIDPRVKAMVPIGSIPHLSTFVRAIPAPSLLQEASSEETRHNPNPPDGAPGRVLQNAPQGPATERLLAIVNPLNFMDHMNMSKLVIMETNNDVLPVDSTIGIATWWSWMPRPKNLLFVEATPRDVMTVSTSQVASYISGVLLNEPMPEIDYTYDSLTNRLFVQEASNHKPVSVSWLSSVSCDPYTLFTGSTWEGRSKAANNSIHSWEEVLVQPGEALPLKTNSTLPCSLGGFLRLSYAWPRSADRFNVSTPVVMEFDVPVHRPSGFMSMSTGDLMAMVICLIVGSMVVYCCWCRRQSKKGA